MKLRMRQVTIANTSLSHFHIAAFVNSREEEYEVLHSHIVEGIAAGDKTVHICDPALCDDHVRRLERMGVPIEACRHSGQLEVISWHDAYLREGRFDSETMLALVDEVVNTAKAEGFPRARLLGHMEWALEEKPGVDAFLEYERRVDDVLNRLQQPAICVYNLQRFRGAEVAAIMAVHPLVVMNGVLQENPYFQPPEGAARRPLELAL
jgi:hypothetical protein